MLLEGGQKAHFALAPVCGAPHTRFRVYGQLFTGVEGNEKADQLAKTAANPQATRWQYCWSPSPTQHQASCKRTAHAQAQGEWEEEWSQASTGVEYRTKLQPLRCIDKEVTRIYANQCKAISAIIIQLRTGKIGLNKYLAKIKKKESPSCECKMAIQSVAHVIEECPFYRRQRQREFGRPVVRNAYEVLSDPEQVVKTAVFMIHTGLLDQFRVVRSRLLEVAYHN